MNSQPARHVSQGRLDGRRSLVAIELRWTRSQASNQPIWQRHGRGGGRRLVRWRDTCEISMRAGTFYLLDSHVLVLSLPSWFVSREVPAHAAGQFLTVCHLAFFCSFRMWPRLFPIMPLPWLDALAKELDRSGASHCPWLCMYLRSHLDLKSLTIFLSLVLVSNHIFHVYRVLSF